MASSEQPAVYDNWEDLEASGTLDKQLERMQTDAPKNGEVTACSIPPDFDVILSEDARAKFNFPPEPVVKILKRPSQRQSSSMGGGDGFLLNGDAAKPRVPVKTLAQREEEYAQARLRILGEAQSPDEDLTQEEKFCRILNKLELLRPDPISRVEEKESGNIEEPSEEKSTIDHWNSDCISSSKESSNLSNSVLTSPSKTTSSSNYYNVNSMMQSKNEESPQIVRCNESNIIRHPRGPDDTNGFSLRR